MSRYEERLAQDKASIRDELRALGALVCEAVQQAARAAATHDVELATETVVGDLRINRRFLELDHRCHRFIARHLPSALHLRFVSGVLRVNVVLERVGDYAETIARAALQLEKAPPPEVAAHFSEIATRAHTELNEAVEAFLDEDAGRAREVRARSKRRGSTFGKTFEDMRRAGGELSSYSATELFSFLAIFSRLERVISQARSICLQTVFVATGQVRDAKTFSILVVDAQGALAQLAAASLVRAYAASGTYQAAALSPSPTPASFEAFAAEKALELEPVLPFAEVIERIGDYDFVLDLTGKVRAELERVPFQTTILPFALGAADEPGRAHEQIVDEAGSLFERLIGEERA